MIEAAHDESSRISEVLRVLREALLTERRALIENDPETLLRVTSEKTKVLTHLATLSGQSVPDDAARAELYALSELNIANGTLVAKRRFETVWVLRQLGVCEGGNAYDAQGLMGQALRRRALARA